jgi:ABC-type sugar transport system permease subunit
MNNNVTEKNLSLSPAEKGNATIWQKILYFLRGSGSLEKRKARAGWVFVLPFVIGLIFIYIPVVINSLQLSFCNLQPVRLPNGTAGTVLEPVGFANYHEALFVDPKFVQTLVGGIQQLIFDIPAIVIFSLFVAVILNQKMFGRAAFRAIFFIPVILSTGLIDAIDVNNAMVENMQGSGIDEGTGTSASNQIINAVDIQRLFANMKVGTELVTYIVTLVNDIYNIVNRSGVQILIFLAGLQSISPSIYEA